jgi:hypothetical protein
VARGLVVAGLVLIALGLLLSWSPGIPLLGKLPGDFRIERPGFRLYVPITSCLVLSLAVSGLLWVFGRLR